MKRYILSLIVGCAFLLVPSSAFAVITNPLDQACHANTAAENASVCNRNTDPIVGPNGALKRVTFVIAIIGGITAVIIMIVSGLQYILSAGDPQKAANARSAIIGAAVGLVIIAGAEGIITFVISKL